MSDNTSPYEILVGSGQSWYAPVGTAFPGLADAPTAPWVSMGDMDGGLTITAGQTVVQHRTDQHTGPIKATRSEENLAIETNLAESTLENIALVLNSAVTDTPAGVGTIGTRTMNLHRGPEVDQYAFLFRAYSPYGPWEAQYCLPVGYFDGDASFAYKKDTKVVILARFVALEDPDAATEDERFGYLVAQDAVAT